MEHTVTVRVDADPVDDFCCSNNCNWLYSAARRCMLFETDLKKEKSGKRFVRCDRCMRNEVESS